MTDLLCLNCGAVRKTDDDSPEITPCEGCGSWDVAYKAHAEEQFNELG